MNEPIIPGARDIAAAFDWWRDAGVDCDYADEPANWLADNSETGACAAAEKPVPEARTRPDPTAAPVPVQARADLLGDAPPQDLALFREWWLNHPALDPVGQRGRVPPRGAAGAQLMVLVPDPEEGDSDTLLSQAQGRLLDGFLAAAGMAPDQVYRASVLPRHTPLAEGSAMAEAGFGAVLLHQVALVAPRRVLAFGTNILPLLGHDAAQDPQSLRKINHEALSVPLLSLEGLDSLLAMPRLKARFWRRWLEWLDEVQ